MIKALKVSLLLYVSINTAMAANPEEQNMSHEQSTVIAAIQTMTTAFHNSDIAGVLASYEKNAAVMFEPAKQESNPIEFKKNFEEFFQLNPKFSYSGHEVYIANDLALHIAPWTMKGNAPDGTIIEQSGLSVAVLRKQADGSWLMVLDNPHGQRLIK